MTGVRQLNRILIIDDDASTAFLHKLLLESMAIAQKVDFITDAFEALLDIRERYRVPADAPNPEPDLILLDLDMPMMSGFQFMQELERLTLDRSKVNIVMLTASLDPNDKIKASQLKLPLDGYLVKPLSKSIMQELVNKIEWDK